MARTLRAPADADADAVAELVNAADLAETGIGGDFTAAELRGEWAEPGFVLDTDAWLAYDGDRLVGYGCAWDQYGDHRITLDLYVRPETASEVGASLVERATERAGELGQGRGALTLRLGQTSGTPLAKWLPAAGWAPVRYFHRMVRNLTEADAARPAPPRGVAIRPVRDDPDARLLHEVIEEAFAQHWAHERSDYEGWLERTEAAHKDRELWWLAILDGQPVGGMLGKPESEGMGWISYLGVTPSARGGGIARHILRSAFAEFARRGKPAVGLTVDTANATGALDLYLAVGMRPSYEIVAWERSVPAA